MSRIALSLALVAALPAAALAQPAKADPSRVAINAIRQNWQDVTTNITRAAEELSEADYAYRPTESVRTFGQLVGHVAGAQGTMCAAALGEKQPDEDAVERSAKTKAALVAALKASTAACARAYGQTDAAAAGRVQLYGQTVPRFHALALNAVHNGEHYGNIVTYMRMKGMVPPSSRR
jgi:uncharacterized damage-inducible protein DinB